MLFLLYINDIYNAIPNAKVKLFADDTNLFLYDKNLDSLCCIVENKSLSLIVSLLGAMLMPLRVCAIDWVTEQYTEGGQNLPSSFKPFEI